MTTTTRTPRTTHGPTGNRHTRFATTLLAAITLATPLALTTTPTTLAAPTIIHAAPTHPGTITNTPTTPAGHTALSTNWSGYAQTTTATTTSHGSWTIPTVTASTTPKYSATWIGIDGYGNNNLIQTGTSQDTTNNTTYYYAWWEILPAPETVIPLTVTPGDKMTATLTKTTPTTWTITLTDTTTHHTYTTTQHYTGTGRSVEGIEEAPTINNHQSTLANFHTVTFSAGNSNGTPASRALKGGAIDMINTTHHIIAQPTNPTGNGFSITYTAPR